MNSNNSEQYNILSLLPYTECAQLINKKQKLDDLYFLKSLVDFSVKGLEYFIEGHLSQFDAQIGENLCQIRAYRVFYLWKKILNSSYLKTQFIEKINTVKEYQKKLNNVVVQWKEAVERSKSYKKELDDSENVNLFLEKNDIFLNLDEEIVFIISCFFLTYFNIRNENIPIAIDLALISRTLNVSKYRAKRLTHKYQQTVCKLGCDFIMNISNELKNFDYSDILPKLYQVSDEDRFVLPCYMASEVIFHHCIKEKAPIFLCVNRKNKNSKELKEVIYFLLIGSDEEEHLTLISCTDYLTDYCIVVSGDMECDILESPQEYVTTFLEKNPFKLILANTAMHPQYSGKKLFEYRNDPFLIIHDKETVSDIVAHQKNLMDMKKFALTTGCSQENPATFFLRHIYASQVAKEISELRQDVLLYEAYELVSHAKKLHQLDVVEV